MTFPRIPFSSQILPIWIFASVALTAMPVQSFGAESVLSTFGSSVASDGWSWSAATSTLSGTEAPGAVLYPESFADTNLGLLGNPGNLSLSLSGSVITAPPGFFSVTLEDKSGRLSVTRISWSSLGSIGSTVIVPISAPADFDWGKVAGWTLDSGGSGEPLEATFTKLAVVAATPTPTPTPSPTPTPTPSPTPSPTPTPAPSPSPSPTPGPSPTPSPTPSPSPTPAPSPTPTPTPTPSPSPTPSPTPTPSPSPSPTPVTVPQARFDGLVGTGSTAQSAADFLASNGIISVKTTTKGTFSGTLRLGADKIAFKGVFRTDGSAQINDLPLKNGQPAIDLNLLLEAGPKISGRATLGAGTELPLVALAPEAGTVAKYTVALVPKTSTAYAGYGYATISTDSKGAAKITGKLADGSKIAASTMISDGAADGLPAEKLVPVFVVPFGKTQGLLTGEMQIDKPELSQGSSVDDGGQPWGWVRSNSSALAELGVRGRSFAVSKGLSIMTGTANEGGFDVSGALTSGPLTGTWPGSNKPAFADKNYKLAFSASGGAIKGSIKIPKITYEGVMFSAPITLSDGGTPVHGAGFRLTTDASLPVEITAAP